MAVYALGDVQGCHKSLLGLLGKVPWNPDRDRLWLTGDLVNRGPRSLEVLRWARDLGPRLVTVLGNHDLHLLACAAGLRRAKGRDTLDPVLAATDREELLAWLRGRPLMHREGDWLLVHAGLLPQWSADQAEELAREVEAELRGPDWPELLRAYYAGAEGELERWSPRLPAAERRALALRAFTLLRMVTREGAMEPEYNGPPAQAPAGLVPWFDAPGRRSAGQVQVVFGHWAALGLHLGEDALGLDTGCVWGGDLCAVRLEDRAVWRQPRLD